MGDWVFWWAFFYIASPASLQPLVIIVFSLVLHRGNLVTSFIWKIAGKEGKKEIRKEKKKERESKQETCKHKNKQTSWYFYLSQDLPVQNNHQKKQVQGRRALCPLNANGKIWLRAKILTFGLWQMPWRKPLHHGYVYPTFQRRTIQPATSFFRGDHLNVSFFFPFTKMWLFFLWKLVISQLLWHTWLTK